MRMSLGYRETPPEPPITAKVLYFTGPHGELDFEKMRAYYGCLSDDVDHFLHGDMTAAEVIVNMDHRMDHAA